MKSEIEVKFSYSDFAMSIEDLSAELMTKPTHSWRKGDLGKLSNKPMKNNYWALSSGLDKSEKIDKHVETLLGKIRPNKRHFVRVGNRFHPVLSCVVYSYGGDRPCLGFSRTVIKELAELGADIDIDLYAI